VTTRFGSDVAATRTRATRDGDTYVIEGSKRFISHGSVADLITVFAVTDPDAPRSKRLSCFVIEVPTEGFSVPRIEHKMGIRGSPTAELAFNGVRVPAANRIGEEGDGFAIAMRTFERSRPGIAAQAVGIAQGALEVATRYAQERRQFGQRIGDLQMVGAMLADMDAATEGARQLLYKACAEIDAGSPDAGRWAATQSVSPCEVSVISATMALSPDSCWLGSRPCPVRRSGGAMRRSVVVMCVSFCLWGGAHSSVSPPKVVPWRCARRQRYWIMHPAI